MTADVDVLGSDTGKFYRTYVGWTLDLDRRLAEHNAGGRSGAKSTRGRVWTIIYAERLPTRTGAMSREYHLKRDQRTRRKLAQTAQGKGNCGPKRPSNTPLCCVVACPEADAQA